MGEIMMMPGFEATLAPAIKEVSGAIDKYLNPHRDFQSAMQKALSTNPQLMQQLVDTEHVNPGTLKNLGFGKIADLLGSMQESGESEFERTNRAGIKQNKQVTLENEMAKNDGVKRDLEKAAKLIAQNTDLSMTAALKLIGQTPIDAKTDQLQLQAAEAQAKINELKLKGAPADAELHAKDTANKLSLADMEAEAIRNAKVMLPDGVEVDTRQEARNFLDGKLDGNRLAALIANPKTSAAFQANLNLIKHDREVSASLEKENRARQDRGTEVTETTKYVTARNMWAQHEGVADIPTWNAALHDPATIKIIERLRESPGSAKPGEEKLLEVAKAMGNKVDLKKLHDANVVGQKINIQFTKLEESTSDGRQLNIDQMNGLLKERAALGGPQLQVKYEDSGWFGGGSYKYVDEKDGTIYTKKEVEAIVADPLKGTAAMLSPKASEALQAVMSHPAGPEAALEGLRATAGPGIVKEVEAAMRAEGIGAKRKSNALPIERLVNPKTWKRRGEE